MNQVNARHEIIREWRSLPRELRQTDEQAAAFAMQIKDKYKFSSDSADHYQTVKDWLLRYLSITRGLEPNAEDEGRMKGDAKSTDPGLSAAERKTLPFKRLWLRDGHVKRNKCERMNSPRSHSSIRRRARMLKIKLARSRPGPKTKTRLLRS
jgi:hypothetical protein